jgi:tetratricopeptide (TPR) repeat protein
VQKGTLRDVAVKYLAPLQQHGLAMYRFAREGEIAAMLEHPNLVRVYGCGESADGPWLAMEYVDGSTLERWVREGGADLRRRVEVFRGICAGVRHAHQAGVIHRDLKPGNVFMTADGVPKVGDFGLACRPDRSMDDLTLTRAGEVFGSLAWMAPEQAAGEWQRVDALSDVHALGAILFFVVAGEPVFPPEMPVAAQWAAAQSGDRPSLRKRVPSVPRDLAAIADRCQHADKHHRYGSVAELEEDIRRWLAGEPVLARKGAAFYWLGKKVRKHWIPVGATAVLLAGAAGLAVERARMLAEREMAAQRGLHVIHEQLSLFLTKESQHHESNGQPELAKAFEERVAQFPWSFDVATAQYDPRRSQGRAALSRAVESSHRGDYSVAVQWFSKAMAQLQPLVAQHPEVTVFREELGQALAGLAVAQNRLEQHPQCIDSSQLAAQTLVTGVAGRLTPAVFDELMKVAGVMTESILALEADDPRGLVVVEKLLARAPRVAAGGPSTLKEFMNLAKLEANRVQLLLRGGRRDLAEAALRMALENGRKAMAEPDREGMAARALAQVHLAEAMLARSRGEGDREDSALMEASRLIVSDSGKIPQPLTIRLHEDLMQAWAARAERLAGEKDPEGAAAAADQGIRCGMMLTRTKPEKRSVKSYWTRLMLRAAEWSHLCGRVEEAWEAARGARLRFRQLAEPGTKHFAANSLGACEAGVLLAEIAAPPYGKQPPWQVVARRDLEQLAALGDGILGEHAEKLAQLRERLASLPAQLGRNP